MQSNVKYQSVDDDDGGGDDDNDDDGSAGRGANEGILG